MDKLAIDARTEPGAGGGGIRFAIILSVDSPDEVDELADHVRRAGGTVTKEPVDAEFFTGRDAYFADPEGKYWEIALASGDNPVSAAARRAAGIVIQDRARPRQAAGGHLRERSMRLLADGSSKSSSHCELP